MLAFALITRLLAAPLAVPPVPFVPDAPQTPAQDDDQTYTRVLAFRRQQLAVRPIVTQPWSAPIPISTDLQHPMPIGGWAPVPGDGTDWGIVRGDLEVLDELDLADLLRDSALRASIEDKRFWPHLAWTTTFSTLGAGAIGTGVWLTWFNGRPASQQRDPVAIGTSLLVAGVTSVALGLLYPEMTQQHALSPVEAQGRCDTYNEQLRHGLQLSPTDLKRF